MNDDELEQAFRAGLERRARLADVDVPVVPRAHEDAQAARRRPWLLLGGLAAAAAVAATVVVLSPLDDRPADRAQDPAHTDDQAEADDPAVSWRTERWGDLQVDVPADWGYGGAPDDQGIACFPAPMLDANGDAIASQDLDGYVGRPVVLTDVCAAASGELRPQSSYVWLGAGLSPGVVDLPGGYTQETVELQGTTLTVATRDPGLRARILGSATGNEMCLAELDRDGPIEHDRAADPQAEPVGLRVCAYRLDREPNGGWELTYAGTLGAGPLRDYLAAVEQGDPPRDQCPTIDYQLDEAVVLELLDADGGVLRQDAVNTFATCAGIAVDAESPWEMETTRLSPEMVRPWAVGGVRAVVHGPADTGLIGPQG